MTSDTIDYRYYDLDDLTRSLLDAVIASDLVDPNTDHLGEAKRLREKALELAQEIGEAAFRARHVELATPAIVAAESPEDLISTPVDDGLEPEPALD